jgi:hypothetical protein
MSIAALIARLWFTRPRRQTVAAGLLQVNEFPVPVRPVGEKQSHRNVVCWLNLKLLYPLTEPKVQQQFEIFLIRRQSNFP